MSALRRWRRKVNEKGLSEAEKEKDLRRNSNQEAFEEFKAKRAEQQRKRRRKKKGSKDPDCVQRVQLIQVKDGVEVFYVNLRYLQDKGHEIKNKVYAEKSAKKLVAKLVQKYKSKRNKKTSDFDVLYKVLSKKKRVFGHESCSKVYATIVV